MKKTLLCAMLFAGISAAAQVSRSDVNLDGDVNSADVVAIYNTIINGEEVGTINLVFAVHGVAFTMVPVDGGTFMMGATAEQEKPYNDEKPAHQVTLSSYYIGRTEVTQELWEAVMGSNPSYWKDDRLPVEQVSWNDCQEFISKLNIQLASQLDGRKFRLPTEAEWEFAARGGNKRMGYLYVGSNTIGDVAWYGDNSDSMTHPVASKQSNELGTYDMNGNVWEWCSDGKGAYSGEPQINPTGPESNTSRVCRGGDWNSNVTSCRMSYRNNNDPTMRHGGIGLRLALSK